MFIKGIFSLHPFKGNRWPNRREPTGGARNSGVRRGTTDDAASYDHQWSKGNGGNGLVDLIESPMCFDGGLTSFVRGRVGNRRRVSLAPQSPGTQFNQAQPDNSCASHPRTDYESQCQPQQYYDNTRNGEKRNVKKKGADAAYQHYGAKE
jgi:hypothetical protein